MPDMSDLLTTSPLTLGTVKCASVRITPEPGRDRSGGTWEIFCMFADVAALHEFLQGGPVEDPDTHEVTYNPTASLPGWDDIYYKGATVEGIPGPDGIVIDPDTGKINYKYANFVARFESRQWGFDAENQGKPSMTAGQEIYASKIGTLKWQSDTPSINGKPVTDSVPVSLPVLNVSLPIYNQADIHWEALTNAQEKPLNSEPMPIFGNVAAKKVRFDGSDVTWRSVTPKPVCDFLHHFSIRSRPWDQELYDDGSFQTIVRANGDPWIPTSDLNLILP